jgi:chromosomal replication initiator protein
VREQLEPVWNRVRAELRREVPDFKFHIWLEPLDLAAIEGNTVFVRAPEHIRGWVCERYLPVLRAAVTRAVDERASVEIVGVDWTGEPARRSVAEPAGEPRRLNPKFTFEQFVIGDGNRLAHAAALAVAEQPGQVYNPLFIYGPAGLGKTHLLHAIGNFVARFGSGMKIRCATVETFTSQFVTALRTGEVLAFKERFRGVDVLLIDDVQFLADKIRTNEEFFHTFNALHDAGRQLVMTSDRNPEELDELDARVTGRLGSGLVVGVETPDVETREAILHKRARLDGLDLSDETIAEIARCVTTSVRALEAALIRVVAHASLRCEPLTPEVARYVLGRLRLAQQDSVTLESIQTATAKTFGLTRAELLTRSRQSNVALARQVAMYLARELTSESLPQIGRQFGGRDHTTVLHAHRRVSERLTQDKATSRAVDRLRRQLARIG